MAEIVKIGETTFQIIEKFWELDLLHDENGLIVGKGSVHLQQMEEYLSGSKIDNIFELGIYRGGSVAYLNERLKPRNIAAIDIRPPVPVLETWIDEKDLRKRVHTFYNVDQADAARLKQICAQVFESDPIDLVIDDASHQLHATRASFNALFPLLRQGGIYIIEDWGWAEALGGEIENPLSHLIKELMLATIQGPWLIESLHVTQTFVAVRRGHRSLEDSFDLREIIAAEPPYPIN